MTVDIQIYDNKDRGPVDGYVMAHPGGSFFHRPCWQTIHEDVMGHKAPALVARRQGIIVGFLPLVFRKSLIFGKAAISGFLGVCGGPVADNQSISDALLDHAWRMAQDDNIPILEMKLCGDTKLNEQWIVARDRALNFERPLASNEAEEMANIPRKQRAVLRKALDRGLNFSLTAKEDHTVYDLYADSVHRLGTPVFSRKLFYALGEVFPDHMDYALVNEPGGEAVASLVTFYHKDRVMPYYAGSTPAARRLGAHDFMYFQVMNQARDRGYKMFDFGRSKVGTGAAAYKKNWGFTGKKLTYAYRIEAGHNIPNLSPQNSQFSMAVRLWRQLPLGMANWLGPYLSRHLG